MARLEEGYRLFRMPYSELLEENDHGDLSRLSSPQHVTLSGTTGVSTAE